LKPKPSLKKNTDRDQAKRDYLNKLLAKNITRNGSLKNEISYRT